MREGQPERSTTDGTHQSLHPIKSGHLRVPSTLGSLHCPPWKSVTNGLSRVGQRRARSTSQLCAPGAQGVAWRTAGVAGARGWLLQVRPGWRWWGAGPASQSPGAGLAQ